MANDTAWQANVCFSTMNMNLCTNMSTYFQLKDNNRIAEALLQKADLMNLKLEEAYKVKSVIH